jgi:hypothetical protein
MAATSPGTEKPASLEAVRTQLTLADDARAQAAEAHLKAALLAVMGVSECATIYEGWLDDEEEFGPMAEMHKKKMLSCRKLIRKVHDGTVTKDDANERMIKIITSTVCDTIELFESQCIAHIESVVPVEGCIKLIQDNGLEVPDEMVDAMVSSQSDLAQLVVECERKLALHETDCAEMLTSLRTAEGKSGKTSSRRRKCIEEYKSDIEFNLKVYQSMDFYLRAEQEINETMEGMRKVQTPMDLMMDPEWAKLTKGRDNAMREAQKIRMDVVIRYDSTKSEATLAQKLIPEKTPSMKLVEMGNTTNAMKVILDLEEWLKKAAHEYFGIIPEVKRMLRDWDSETGTHYKSNAEERETWDASYLKVRDSQNKSFASSFLSQQPNKASARKILLASDTFGDNKIEFKADEGDGMGLLWVYLQHINPTGQAVQRQLLKEIEAVAKQLKKGNPMDKLEKLSELVVQADDMGAELVWYHHGSPVISALTGRTGNAGTRFETALRHFEDKPKSEKDDAGPLMSKLIAKAKEITGDLKSDLGEDKAFSSGALYVTEAAMRAALTQSERGGKKAKAVTTKQKQGKPKPKAAVQPQKEGHCQKVGCNHKILGWTQQNRWKLCATCLLEVRTKGKAVKLRDGGEFLPRIDSHALVCAMAKAGVLEGEIADTMSEHADEIHAKKAQKAERLAKRAGKRKLAADRENDSEGEPSLHELKNSKKATKKIRFDAASMAGKDARTFIQKARAKRIEGMDSD